MFKGIKKTAMSLTIFSVVLLLMIALSLFAVKFSTIFYILICGTIGLCAFFFAEMQKRKEGEK